MLPPLGHKIHSQSSTIAHTLLCCRTFEGALVVWPSCLRWTLLCENSLGACELLLQDITEASEAAMVEQQHS